MTSFVAARKRSIHNHHSQIYFDLHVGEIRLVTLLKGQWSDEIRCELHHALLNKPPTYKALSYAWGSPRATRLIIVDGYRHLVTVNLESALRRIRRSDSDLVIWIDALCINQSNISERTEQVKLMHDIFASTEEVIAYLGEAPCHGITIVNPQIPSSTTTFNFDDSDQDKLEIFRTRCLAEARSNNSKIRVAKDYAFDVLCLIRLLAEKNLNSLPAFDSSSRQFIDSKYQHNVFEGLRQLMLSRWWKRIWVIQEIVVPKYVTIVYGSIVAPWDMFVGAADWESRNRYTSRPFFFPHEYSIVLTRFSRMILDIERMRKLWRDNKQTALLPLLQQFSGRKASDDRDKVFALLSLARDQTTIAPDYSLSVSSVFELVVFDIIRKTKSLAIFAGDLGRKERQDLPSWVPDWSATYNDLDRRRASNTDKYCATNGCQIYLQDNADEESSGIHQYLGLFKSKFDAMTTQDYIEFLNLIVETSEWTEFLPGGIIDLVTTEMCLSAVEKFYTFRGRAVCLKNYGDGVIEVPGMIVDSVVACGKTPISDDELPSVIQSWAFLLVDHFQNVVYDHPSTGLDDAFRRTLCADVGDSARGLEKAEHEWILSWLLQAIDQGAVLHQETLKSSSWTKLWKTLFNTNLFSDSSPKPVPARIDDAIRSATLGRTFFITGTGYIGLGPAKMQKGDLLYMLMGGHTPFILRHAGSRKIPNLSHEGKQKCFEIIGDCYAHGLMNGEFIYKWRRSLDAIRADDRLQELSRQKRMWLEQSNDCDSLLPILALGSAHADNPLHKLPDLLKRCIESINNRKERTKPESPSFLDWLAKISQRLQIEQLLDAQEIVRMREQLAIMKSSAIYRLSIVDRQVAEREAQIEKYHVYLV